MLTNADHVRSLRIALQASPDNVALRQHLAQLLLSMGEFEAAVDEFSQALDFSADDGSERFDLKLGLARALSQQGKDADALGLIVALISQKPDHAELLALHAKLLLRVGDSQGAIAQFRQALMQDDSLKDSELAEEMAEQVGVTAQGIPQTSDSTETEGSVERPMITFEAVGGMEALKEEIRLKIIVSRASIHGRSQPSKLVCS